MRVKCIRILDSQGLEKSSSPHIEIGKDYLVVAIESGTPPKFRLSPDHGVSVMWHASMFEVIESRLASTWRVWVNPVGNGYTVLGPAAWYQDDFWNRLFDGEASAVETYNREIAIMEEDDRAAAGGC